MLKVFLFILMLSLNLFAGTGAGNGGDFVRMEFIRIGNSICETFESGFQKIKPQLNKGEDYKLNKLSDLKNYLNINFISTSVDPLFDNRGNLVNALGSREGIILYVGDFYKELSWSSILRNRRYSVKLVLHEMLRGHGVNDDDYKYSDPILEKQDLTTKGSFKMKWSGLVEQSIKVALQNSLRVKSLDEEIDLFHIALDQIQDSTVINFAFLLNLPPSLSRDIDQTEEKKSYLSLLRNDLRLVSRLIPLVDSLAFKFLLYGEIDENLFNQYLFQVTRDFAAKLSFYNVLKESYMNHINRIEDIFSSLNIQESCTHYLYKLENLKKMDIETERSDARQELNLMGIIAQSNNCAL